MPDHLTSNSAVYEVQEGMDRDLNKQFRVTDTRTDSRVATCYVQSNADLVCAALNAYTADEPGEAQSLRDGAAQPPKDPREERLREAFLKCRQMLATQTGTFYNAAHFGLTPEDIGMERASVTKDAAQPMHGGALVAPGRCDNGECWCHGGISAETKGGQS